MTINEKNNTAIMISSLGKIYNNIRLRGTSNSKDLYLLDSIYKILNGCYESLSYEQRKELFLLYEQVSKSSNMICYNAFYSCEQDNQKSDFRTESENSCSNYPSQNNIYYWQELEIGKSTALIISEAFTQGFVDDKEFDSFDVFTEGKELTYSNVGKIGFLISGINSTDNYKIYDINNNDVTSGFVTSYSSDIKSRIFVSFNEYVPSTITLKIKK
jgi:hypothetical protein